MRKISLKFRTRSKNGILYLHVSIDGVRDVSFSLSHKLAGRWDVGNQCFIGKMNAEEQAIYDDITNLRAKAMRLFVELKIADKVVSNKQFINLLIGEKKEKITFVECWEKYLSEHHARGAFEPVTERKHYQAFGIISDILSDLNLSKILPEDLNRRIAENIYFQLLNRCNDNAEKIQKLHAYRIFKHLDRVLDYCWKEEIITANQFAKFGIERPKDAKREIRYLTEFQLNRLYNLSNISAVEQQVIDIFTLLSYTGFAYADYKEFIANPRSFIYSDGDYSYINKRRFKTRKDPHAVIPHIPLFPRVFEILERYDYDLPYLCLQFINRTLKPLAKRAGVADWQKVTTYTARKTAATLISNLDGVEIKTVSKFLGHKDSRTTIEHYAITEDNTVKRQLIHHIQPKTKPKKVFQIWKNAEVQAAV